LEGGKTEGEHASCAARVLGAGLVFILCLAPAADALAQGYVTAYKMKTFRQTSPTEVAVAQDCQVVCPYHFNVNVSESSMGSIAAPVLSGPVNVPALGSSWNGGRLGRDPGLNQWSALWFSTTQADLDAKFPDGTYTVSFDGLSAALTLSGNQYPAPAVLTLTGGEWRNGEYVIDPRQALTVTTSPTPDTAPTRRTASVSTSI
jgi:hypothetical protein